MASKISEGIIKGDILLIKEMGKHLRYSKDEINFMIKLAKQGIVAVETLVEVAISKVAKVERSTKDGEDFVNGWDSKKGTVNWHGAGNKNALRKCSIGTKNKTGDLICVIADSLVDEIFYFKIPKSEYQNQSQIKITFDPNGGPATKFVKGSHNWRMWNLYRCKNFKELCKTN